MIAAGLIALVLGGEWLVRGASSLAKRFHISPLVIGLTVVAFGTSAPELGVSVVAAFRGQGGVAVGNVIGSNIINTLFVLGAAAAVAPLVVSRQILRKDLPILMFASAATAWFASDGIINRWEGTALFCALLIYITHGIRASRRESREASQANHVSTLGDDEIQSESKEEDQPPAGSFLVDLIWFFAGLVALAFGARWLVGGASEIARYYEVSDLLIGLTVVAIGTSLPEVVTSVIAALRGERDIAVGNVIGSNLFNLMCVLGLTAIVDPKGIPIAPEAIHFDIPVMLAVTIICFPFFWTSDSVSRWEGWLLLFYYASYNTVLIADAIKTRHYDMICSVLSVVIAITLIPILISVWNLRKQPVRA